MAGALLILLAMVIQLIATCPSSCVVCSEDITLCQGLTYILAASASTKALIITDGSILSVEGFNLSFLLNATLLRLSSNRITTIKDDAFLGLRTLKTLLLDQNQISSSSITYSTFHELRMLQILKLSNNILSSIHGIWFKNMKDLIRLHLSGNQLTSITGDSFEMANLGNLRILDLSNNFINSIAKKAFHGLMQLMEIDLSRNRLALIPDTFSSLTQLNLLSLDQNWWNCTCKLYDLASFLRKYVNSSSRTLKNADNMSCTTSENPGVSNLLELTEVNCGVGLTCLVLGHFNRKLQHGQAKEHSSGNCCCGTVDESHCGHNSRNYLTKDYCDCHLTQKNEIKGMSTLGSGEEMLFLQENSHQETVKAESKYTSLKMPPRSIQMENEQMKTDEKLCLNCTLLQIFPQGSFENRTDPSQTGVPHQKHFQRRARSPQNSGQWEKDPITTRLELHPSFIQAEIRSNTFCGRCSRPACVLAKEKLGKTTTNALCQSLSKREANACLKSYREQHTITAMGEPEESKEQCLQAVIESQLNNQSGLTARSKNFIPQQGNFLTCKYLECHPYQGYLTIKKQNHGKNLRLRKRQHEVKDGRAGGCCLSDEEMPLSPAIKTMFQPKTVSFHVLDLAKVKKLRVSTGAFSEETCPKNKGQDEWIQRNQLLILARKSLRHSVGKNKEKKPSAGPVDRGKKENELNQKHRVKTKRQDVVTGKLNLYPFRKARVHPEKSLPKENTKRSSCSPHVQFQDAPRQAGTRAKPKRKSEYDVAAQDTLENCNVIIYSKTVAEKLPQQRATHEVPSLPGPLKSVSALSVTKGASLAKHLQMPSCTGNSLPCSPGGISRLTGSVTGVSSDHSPSISQDRLDSTECKDDATETCFLPFHQNSLVTASKEKKSSPAFTFVSQADFQKRGTEADFQLQQISTTAEQSLSLDWLKRQNEHLAMRDQLEGHERTGLSESAEGHEARMESLSSEELPLSNGYHMLSEKDISRSKSPLFLSNAFVNSYVNECLTAKEGLQTPDGTYDVEEYERKTQHMRVELNEFTKIPDSPIDLVGLNEEGAQTRDICDRKKCECRTIVSVTMISNTASIPSSPESGKIFLDNCEMNSNVHMDLNSDLQDIMNNQLVKGNSERTEGKTPTTMHQECSLLPEFKEGSYEQGDEMSYNTMIAEMSVPKVTFSSTSPESGKELTLQVEKGKTEFSNNSYSLALFKDKKHFSI